VHFNEFWMANTRKCEHIKHENYNEEEEEPDIVLWEMLTELFVRSYSQQNKVLIIFFLISVTKSYFF
jgi:hypothetical protein